MPDVLFGIPLALFQIFQTYLASSGREKEILYHFNVAGSEAHDPVQVLL